MSTASGPDGSLLRVVHGSPTPEELAAAVAVVLTALQHRGAAGPHGPTPAPWRRAESPASPRVSWRGGR
ncbi:MULTISPECIES: acyl-CoA carboxylase epsilon subunit [unclassified Streptomyces]|uniref:acyl-CoA carboxylase epsilon subunit n=1 Tax=unclassified Streptomyces TaxID=2593676 RepID=UPI00093A39F9|nr:acyl-CoA carboxylase epsilon subunit [Streptomyces sp. TSRI0281]